MLITISFNKINLTKFIHLNKFEVLIFSFSCFPYLAFLVLCATKTPLSSQTLVQSNLTSYSSWFYCTVTYKHMLLRTIGNTFLIFSLIFWLGVPPHLIIQCLNGMLECSRCRWSYLWIKCQLPTAQIPFHFLFSCGPHLLVFQ